MLNSKIFAFLAVLGATAVLAEPCGAPRCDKNNGEGKYLCGVCSSTYLSPAETNIF